MSNTKQQIEEILDYAETFYNDSRWEERERLNPTYTELEGKIDRLVTEAKQDVLKELVEWYEYALSVDDTSFDWYRAVKALMVSKDHKKPFSQLNDKEGE